MMAREYKMRIQKYEYIGEGVVSIVTPDNATITPAVSPVWVADAYNSTVALNLLIVDSNGKVTQGKVKDTSATAITFDEDDQFLVEDGATAGTFVEGATLQFYVLTPSDDASAAYGPYLGDVEGMQLSVVDEVMIHKYDVPLRTRRTDLKERLTTIEGGVIQVTNDDVFEFLTSAANYGKQTGQTSVGVGSYATFDNFYRVTFESDDVEGRDEKIIVHKMQVALNGNFFSKSASGHLMVPFKGTVLADDFYPETANLFIRVSSDT
jgi:hypothetical protein